jgi:hypothetical protein
VVSSDEERLEVVSSSCGLLRFSEETPAGGNFNEASPYPCLRLDEMSMRKNCETCELKEYLVLNLLM